MCRASLSLKTNLYNHTKPPHSVALLFMKRTITTLFLAVFSIWSAQAAYAGGSVLVSSGNQIEFLSDASVSETSKESYLREFLLENNIHTVEQYAAWLRNNVEYRVDSLAREQWIPWPTMLTRKYGDCKAISGLNKKVLELLGYEPLLIGYKNAANREGHVFTVFLKDGHYSVFDNTSFHETKATSIAELSMFIYKEQNIELVFEVIGNPKTFKILYTRTTLAELIHIANRG